MKLTAELSVYPFREDYRDGIKEFIQKLNEYDGIRIDPGPTSTVVIGEFATVMACISDVLRWSHDSHGRSVLVVKYLAGYDPSESSS